MALTYSSSSKNSLNGKSFVEHLGFGEAVKVLDAKGWQFKLTSKNLVIENGSYKFEKGLTLEFLQAVGAGTASPSEVAAFKQSLQLQLSQALSIDAPISEEAAKQPLPVNAATTKAFFFAHGDMADKVALIKKYREAFGVGLKEAKDAVEAYLATKKGTVTVNVPPEQVAMIKMVGSSKWGVFDLAKLNTAQVVKLRDAKQMYQPVKGSSTGSRYFLIAADDDVRVAARYHGSTLSIRIEGPNWKKYKATIAQAGFSTVDDAKDYASVHLAVESEMLANKSLGAVLMGLGVQFETPLPALKVIAGKGG